MAVGDDLSDSTIGLSYFIRLARPQAREVGMTLEGRRVGVAAVEDGVDRRLGLGAPRQRQRERRAPPHALAVMRH